MSISHYKADSGNQIIVLDSAESIVAFKQLLARACNCWPDAPVEIKELHDKVIHGHVLQNYKSLAGE